MRMFEVGDGMGENAPAAPQANAWGRLPRPIVAATMNARIVWMRPEGQRTVQWPYICAEAHAGQGKKVISINIRDQLS
jgi:hypothetical protein